MTRYLARKFVLYLMTFFLAVTIDWAIPRLMPGDPVQGLIARLRADSTASQDLEGYFTKSFGLDRPLWQQYLDFWRGLSTATSASASRTSARRSATSSGPRSRTRSRCSSRRSSSATSPATGRRARRPPQGARQHRPADRATSSRRRPTCGSRSCSRTSSPSSGASSPSPGRTTSRSSPSGRGSSSRSFLAHWFLPFLSLFLVSFGGWAIGMRNLIIYELEADYANYLAVARGAAAGSSAGTPTGTPSCRSSPDSRSRSARSSAARS